MHTQVLDREAIDAIPTGRSIQGMAQLIVGISLNLPDTGGARAMQQTYMTTHGMTLANNTVLVDGMMVNGLQLDGGVQSYFNDAMNQEVSYQTSGIGADTAAGGVRLNMIPREGGNRFSGDFKVAVPAGRLAVGQPDRSRTSGRGLTLGNATDRIVDTTFALGGPIMRDKLWFFTSARYYSVNNFIANTFFDDGSQGVDDQYIKSAMARADVADQSAQQAVRLLRRDRQVSRPRHAEQRGSRRQRRCSGSRRPTTPATLKWTSTVSSRMLLEAGYSRNLEYYTNSYQDGVEQGAVHAGVVRQRVAARERPRRAQDRGHQPRTRRARSATTSRRRCRT